MKDAVFTAKLGLHCEQTKRFQFPAFFGLTAGVRQHLDEILNTSMRIRIGAKYHDIAFKFGSVNEPLHV